jgi:hypothetical protein
MRRTAHDLCRGYSAECLLAAEQAKDRNRKALMFEMAMAWLKLADHADEIAHILADRVVDRSAH